MGSIGSSGIQSLSGLSAAAAAQRQQDMFKRLDTDGDGKITEKELKSGIPENGKGPSAAEILKQIDTNKDGSIDKGENDAFMTKMEKSGRPPKPPRGGGPKGPPPSGGAASSNTAAQIFDELDTNKDGKVSMTELLAAMGKVKDDADVKELFNKVDTNGDGLIDKDENESFLKALEERRNATQSDPDSYDAEGNGRSNGIGGSVDEIA
jgi:Ca2+-binding EF-hand superfamily protein